MHQPPFGFNDPALWKTIVKGSLLKDGEDEEHRATCRNIRDRFLDVEANVRHNAICKSRVTNFFLDFQASDFDFDLAVNALALVNALILTIPFGMASNFSFSYFNELQHNLYACPDNSGLSKFYAKQLGYTYSNPITGFDLYTDIYEHFVRNTSTAVYASMCGLILASLYYLFRPSSSDDLTINGRMRQRCLILSLFSCTVGSITGLLLLWADIVTIFFRKEDDFCETPPFFASDTVVRGVVAIVFAFVVGIICMF